MQCYLLRLSIFDTYSASSAHSRAIRGDDEWVHFSFVLSFAFSVWTRVSDWYPLKFSAKKNYHVQTVLENSWQILTLLTFIQLIHINNRAGPLVYARHESYLISSSWWNNGIRAKTLTARWKKEGEEKRELFFSRTWQWSGPFFLVLPLVVLLPSHLISIHQWLVKKVNESDEMPHTHTHTHTHEHSPRRASALNYEM